MTDQTTGVAVRQSVVVRAPQAHAFAVFTEGFATWWPLTYSIGPKPAVNTVIEPRAGGRCYERAADGSECDWGRVLTWEPPHRVVLSWDISPDWKPDREFASQVEVRFQAEDESTTRVELEHRGLEVYGDQAEEKRRELGGGWPELLERFAATAATGGRRGVKFVAIAIHHARPEHVEDFVAYMRRVRAAVGDPPGLVDFHGYRETQSSRLVGLSRWESEQAFQDALAQIGSLRDERRDEWSERPDDVLMLTDL